MTDKPLPFQIPERVYRMYAQSRGASDGQRPPRTAASSFWSSEIGSCGRKISYSMLGYAGEETDGHAYRIFNMGDLVEANLIKELRTAGFSVTDCAPTQRRVVIRHPFISGKIDGIITGRTGGVQTTRLLELKSMNDRGFKELQAKGVQLAQPSYYLQIQSYLFALGLDEATILVDAKNDQKLYEETVISDPLVLADSFLHLQYVRECVGVGELAEPEYFKKTDWRCRFCAFAPLCPGREGHRA